MTLKTLSLKKRAYNDTQTNDVPKDGLSSTQGTKILKKQTSEKSKITRIPSARNFLSSRRNSLYSWSEYDDLFHGINPAKISSKLESSSSPSLVDKQNAAALVLQKSYKSYQIRRRLADCAIVAEELWWRAWAVLMTYDLKQPETAKGRWARAKFRAAKVGKGLSKDENATKLALRHWLEAIDPCHRYGHNLQFYYDVWFASESSQPFFYWLDIGDGKEVNLVNCSRTDLKHQRIIYLGPKERKDYEVIIDKGKLVYKQSGRLLHTAEGSKWMYVLSTSRNLYVGQKKKGRFQHSSFLAGGAATAAGRLIAHEGVLEAIWPYSGHYHPTEENFMEFVNFLMENKVDLTNVKRCANDDDIIPSKISDEEKSESAYGGNIMELAYDSNFNNIPKADDKSIIESKNQPPSCKPGSLLHKWSTGAGPRIRCVREYPSGLQFQALEQVKLSPRFPGCAISNVSSIPSPRPSPSIHLSPRIAHMGFPSPSVHDSSV